jgi:predicted choloylglycine hydrolase
MTYFQGNHFEIGCQIGRYYAEHGVEPYPVTAPDLLGRQIKYYERFAPEILSELRGIAEGGNYLFEEIAHEALVSEILYWRDLAAHSCSIGGFKDCHGDTWVARNYDWHSLVAEQFQVWRFDMTETNVVAISDMGVGAPQDTDKKEQRFYYHDAINSHGLFIGLTYAHCWSTGIGLTSEHAVKLVSWRCKTVDEALRFFHDTRLGCPKNFFIADANGKMAVVEHAVEDMHVRHPDENGVLVITNHYAEPLTAFDRISSDSIDENGSLERYSRLELDLKRLVQTDRCGDFALLEKIMTDPGSPVCQFWPEFEIETVWTLLLDLNHQNYRLIRNPRSAQQSQIDFAVPR